MKTKKIFSLAIAILLSYSFTACKPDNNEPQPPLKSYADVTLADIKAKETLMTTNDIVVSDANGIKLKSGDIFFYKTNKGKFGKIEIESIDKSANYLIKCRALTYYESGMSEYVTNNNIAVRGTWLCELDDMGMGETEDETVADFKNERQNATNTQIKPQNGAKFVKYSY